MSNRLLEFSCTPVAATERRRNRTFQAWGCHALPVLKTGWATRPLPLRRRCYAAGWGAMAMIESTNPANLQDVVARVEASDAQSIVDAARRATEAQRAWAAVPAPIRGTAIREIGRLVERNKEALAR